MAAKYISSVYREVGVPAHVCQVCYEIKTIKELWEKLIVYVEESGS